MSPNSTKNNENVRRTYSAHALASLLDTSMALETVCNSSTAAAHKSTTTMRTLHEATEVTQDNSLKFLLCTAQSYAWGRHGLSSTVAKMRLEQEQQLNIETNEIQQSQPYAELWVGSTHPNGMSQIYLSNKKNVSLQNGGESSSEYNNNSTNGSMDLLTYTNSKSCSIPFLLKVLSIEKVLSIQAHPDKALAEKLHAERPHVYKDPNHKPEMAIALTDDFEAMCGFRPLEEISAFVVEYEEFKSLIGPAIAEELIQYASKNTNSPNKHDGGSVLRRVFHAYTIAPPENIEKQLKRLISRLQKKHQQELTEVEALMLKLADQFPGDSGIMAPLILNHVKLNRGEALFIGPNEPHAYISGEILECQACSDNVVRAGLTPKLKDVDTLVSMLTYKCMHPYVTLGCKLDSYTTVYIPPVIDFALEIIDVPPESVYEIRNVTSPSVLLILSGDGVISQGNVPSINVSFGCSLFAEENTTATICSGENGVKIVRAMSNIYYIGEAEQAFHCPC